MGEVKRSDIDSLRDSIISSLEREIDNSKDLKKFREKYYDDMSSCFERQMYLCKDILKFSKILEEFNIKLSRFDKKMVDVDDRIKNLNYISLKREKEKIERDNINKVWWYLFFISFLCIVLYFTIV